jgi:type VI secretion system protein VasI
MMDNPLQQAIAAIKAGDKSTGKRLLAQVLQADPRNESAWLWLSYAVDNVAQKRQCLERVLKLNPANQTARRQLGAIDRLEAATVQPVQAAPRRRSTESKSIGKPKKRTGLTVGLVIAGIVTVVCVSLVGIWWAINSGLLPLKSTSPVISDATQVNATPPPTNTPKPSTGKWRTEFDTSSFDDSQTVILYLKAEKEISGWLTDYTPVLYIRCKEHELDLFIDVGMSQDVEYGATDYSTVRIRLDSEEAQTLKMGHSTDGESLFSLDPESWIEAMMHHDKMVFGFTPFNAPPVETNFDLRGLSEAIDPLLEACEPTPSPTPPPTATPLPVGSSIFFDDWEIQVEEVLTVDSIEFLDEKYKAEGRFALVFIAVRNQALYPRDFEPWWTGAHSLRIEDASGETHGVQDKPSMAAWDQYHVDIGLDVNPDETAHIVCVFDIPKQGGLYVLGVGRLDSERRRVLLEIP